MKEISDENLLDITQIAFQSFQSKRKQQALEPIKLKEFKQSKIKPLYLRKQDENHNLRKYQFGEACCQESPGSFLCNQKQPNQSFIKYGLGICLYFNYLKYSSCFYIILSVLAIMACSICFAVAIQNGFSPLNNYTTFFFSSTYGTFGSQHNKCEYGKINSLTNQVSFSVFCPYGTLNKFGTVFTLQSLNSLHNCYNQRKKQNMNQSSTSNYILLTNQSCNSNGTSCSISVQFNGLQTYNLVSYTYECTDNIYNYGPIKANSSQFLYVNVSIDIFFCLCYLVFLIIQNVSENRQENYFKSNQLTLSDFTIEIEGLYRNTADKQLLQLIKYINQKFDVPVENNLLSYTLPECQEMISTHYKQRQAYENIYNLVNKYYFSPENASQDFKECHKNVLERIGEAQYQQFRKELKEQIYRFKNFKRKQIYKQSFEALPLYLVFNKINDKTKVMTLQQKTCCSNKLMIEDRQYQFKQPPLPDMILWQNRNKWTKTRIFFSWISTTILCLCSYMLFGYIQFKQGKILSTYNYNIDCNVLYTSAQLSTFNSTLSADINYQTCVCKDKSLTSLAIQSTSFCNTWQKQYVLYLIIPLLISMGIVVYNVLISYVFKILTKFQKHKFIVEEQISYTFKRAFLLILNMGVIMTVLNVNFNPSNINNSQISFMFAGKYDGFTADWYSVIGAIIIMTMIFNIAFPIIELCLTSLFKGLTKLWDTRCCRVPTSRQTKSQYLALYSNDIFPIGQRYAYLIATIFVNLAFCGVIPILIPVTAISLFLLYFADKILLFKIYQIPINYTKSLHSILSKIIFVALLIHFAFTGYLLAQPTMIAKNEANTPSLITSGSARLNSMFSVNYIIPYSAIFLLLVVFIILKVFVFDLFSKCIDLVKNSFIQPEEKFQQLQLVKLLDKRQIATLLKISQLNLETIQLRRNQSLLMTLRATSEKEFAEQIASQEQIIEKSMSRLQEQYKNKANIPIVQNITLLGQASYEYLTKDNQFDKYEDMVEFQRNIMNGAIKKKDNSTGFTYKKKADQSEQNLERMFEVADP